MEQRHIALAITVLALGAACTDDSEPGGDDTTDGGAVATEAIDSGTASEESSGTTGGQALVVDFPVTNLPAGFEATVTDGMVFDGVHCETNAEIDTDTGKVNCIDNEAGAQYTFELVDQPTAGKVAVFATRFFRIEQSIQVRVIGKRPLLIVALEDGDILGSLSALPENIYTDRGQAGGFNGGETKGEGPGGGSKGSSMSGAGAGYCGTGGDGGPASTPGIGGTPYGSDTLSPLLGGSGGGGGNMDGGGAGGGAVQIAAGGQITVGIAGYINAGGGPGDANGEGGGSGGAILLEAPEVTMAGVLAANGGGGASGFGVGDGGYGSPDAQPAHGGGGDQPGAPGGAGDTIDGGAGPTPLPSSLYPGYSGGGGGAVGRIRINTASGAADISGTVSPSLTTPCVSQGTLPD